MTGATHNMFTTSYTLPVSQRVVSYSDFTNAILFDVIRCLTNNNIEQIEKCFDDVVTLMTTEDVNNMCSVDKFCLLIDIRSMYLGDQLELLTSDEKKVKIKLSTMMENLTKQMTQCVTSSIIEVGDISIDVGIPRSMIVDDYDKLIEQSIIKVHHDDIITAFNQFTPSERASFVDSLPAETLHSIVQHIKHVQQVTGEMYLIPHNKTIGLEGVKLGLYDNSMIEILRSLFAEDLMNFYEMQFSLITKMRVTYEHFMKMTPSESKIFVNLYNKDIKKQEEAMNKQQNNHPGGRGIGGI